MSETKEIKVLDRAAILAAADVVTEVVAVPEWGGSVRVRSLSAAERDALEEQMLVPDGRGGLKVNTKQLRAKLVAAAVVDANGQPAFTAEDVAALGQKSAIVLERVFRVAQRLAGMTEEAIKEADARLTAAQG